VSETGQVVPARDPVALAAAGEELLDLGQRGRNALGQAARIRVVDLFSLSSVVTKYEELYEGTLAQTEPLSDSGSVAYQPLSQSFPDEKA
jgi:glycosyltransferase involved in cell wall biosynthesis